MPCSDSLMQELLQQCSEDLDRVEVVQMKLHGYACESCMQ